MCSQVIPSSLFPLSPSRGTRPHSHEAFFHFCFSLTSFDRAGPPAPATVTTVTSPQPRHHHTRTRYPSTPPLRHGCDTLNPTDPVTTTASTPPRCHHLDTAFPLPRPRHLDTAATAATLSPTSCPSTCTGVVSIDTARHLDPTTTLPPALSRHNPTAASTPAPPTRSPRLNPTPSALHARSPVRQAHIPR
ncbi:hypothetical protein EDB84DRAFT_1537659 [Lactarius hengduanensis]|nr:hypothetical protein EDB84DRAFT_1537659 [Lactarius hengduanensis]